MAKTIVDSFVNWLSIWLYQAGPWREVHSHVVFAQDLSVPLKGLSLTEDILPSAVLLLSMVIICSFMYLSASYWNKNGYWGVHTLSMTFIMQLSCLELSWNWFCTIWNFSPAWHAWKVHSKTIQIIQGPVVSADWLFRRQLAQEFLLKCHLILVSGKRRNCQEQGRPNFPNPGSGFMTVVIDYES